MTVFLRVVWVIRKLAENEYPNASKIAQRFEVSTKTGQRTIDFVRDQLGAKIEYCPKRRGWKIKEGVCTLPNLLDVN